jgi:iron complex transport system substrate-binding protein
MNIRFQLISIFILILDFQRVCAQNKPIPQRIISLSPNLTELVYDIGAQDQLVGDTDFCKFPPEAQKKEKIGGWINPNFEKIVSLKPDLVMVLTFDEKAIFTLKKLKIPMAIFNCDRVQNILENYNQMGQLMGREIEAKTARLALMRRLDKIKKRAKGKKPLSVLFVIGRTPGTIEQVYAVGGKNFINELIQMAGGINVMADAMTDYPMVSKEELIHRDPDLIVDSILSHDLKGSELEKKGAWNQMPILKAVKQNHVYYFSNQDFLIPGPSMVRLGEFLCDTFEKVRTDHE